MIATYQYRIYPSKAQTKALMRQLSSHCFVYNAGLEKKRQAIKGGSKVPNYASLAKNLKIWRKESFFGGECNYSSLQQTLRRLEKSFNKSRSEGVGMPRFKSGDRWNTIEWSVYGDGWGLKDGKLRIQNVGDVKVVWHRELPSQPRRLSVTRRGGKWFANFTVDAPERYDLGLGEIGIDWGLKNIATLSNGRSFKAPRPLMQNLKKLRKVDRKLCKNKTERNLRIRRSLHAKIANQRKDFNHKTSSSIVKNNCVLCLEDFKPREIPKRYRRIRRAYADVAIGQLISMVKCKAESAGIFVMMVNPAFTSQECPSCAKRNKFPLSERTYSCECGYNGDRDVTAANNILRIGLAQCNTTGLCGLGISAKAG